MPLQMELVAITLDCPDPLALAAFYQQATGFEPHPKSDAEFARPADVAVRDCPRSTRRGPA